MNAQAKNFERIVKARNAHDASCAFPAHTILMNPVTIDRLGWEAGDQIGGLTLEADGGIQTDCFLLLCDKDRPRAEEEAVEAVSEREAVSV